MASPLLQRERKPAASATTWRAEGSQRNYCQQGAGRGEDAIERLQATLEEIRDRLPEVDKKQLRRTQKDLNKRVADLNSQAQDLIKELRASSMFNR